MHLLFTISEINIEYWTRLVFKLYMATACQNCLLQPRQFCKVVCLSKVMGKAKLIKISRELKLDLNEIDHIIVSYIYQFTLQYLTI